MRLKKDSPSLILGIGEIAAGKSWEFSGGVKTLPYAVDLSAGRRAVLLYTDLIYPAVEYEDNSDSRVLKTFLVRSLDGINNFVFAKPDLWVLKPSKQVNEISSGFKFNTGEYITSRYPVFLDLRLIDVYLCLNGLHWCAIFASAIQCIRENVGYPLSNLDL